jgi:hypothetical protein
LARCSNLKILGGCRCDPSARFVQGTSSRGGRVVGSWRTCRCIDTGPRGQLILKYLDVVYESNPNWESVKAVLANRKVPWKNNSHLLVLSCLSFHFSDEQFGENLLFANVGRSVSLRTEYIDWRNNCLYSLSRARDEYPAITRYQTRSPYYSSFGQDSCRTSHDSMTPWNPQPQFCKM